MKQIPFEVVEADTINADTDCLPGSQYRREMESGLLPFNEDADAEKAFGQYGYTRQAGQAASELFPEGRFVRCPMTITWRVRLPILPKAGEVVAEAIIDKDDLEKGRPFGKWTTGTGLM